MIELKNKKILVLGASGFIGREIAITLSELGAKVIISGTNTENLEKTFSLLKNDGHHLITFDLKKIEEIKKLFKSIIDLDGKKLQGLVYCPAIFPIRPLRSMTSKFLEEMMLINYYSFIESVKCFSNKKVCEGGSIVSISSIASTHGEKGQLAYAATKAAMDSSIIVISKEIENKNIRINSIRPAALLPEEIDFSNLPISIQNTINDMKTGPIKPKYIAEQTAFLLSNYSLLLNGQSFHTRGYLE